MVAKQLTPLAFMSYVRFDDQHENGRLTEFRNRLSGEVRMQTGEDFSIFQDRNDIQWGQNWKERIEDSIDEVTFLIAIITPSFFNSPACRDELELFLAREKKLKRNDLILPVYYVSSAVLDEELKRAKDKLAQEIAKHQFADWRELRFEPFTSPQVGKTLAQLAIQIRNALERTHLPKITVAKPKVGKKQRPAPKAKAATAHQPLSKQAAPSSQAAQSGEGSVTTSRAPIKPDFPPIIVDPLHRGDFTTITEAIAQAKAGDKILVRPGLYQEGLVIDKPLEIIGDGEPGEIVIQIKGKHAVLFKTTMGRITNLSLRQMGDGRWYGVDIAQGRLELDGCDITSQSLACVAIHNGADPRLRRNRIRDGGEAGVFVYDNGQGTLEDNDIFGNARAGVEIRTGGNPALRRNRIRDGKASGVFINENGHGTLEDNDIFSNVLSGVQIKEGSNPTLRRNRIHNGKENGVLVNGNGQGILEDNDIFGNTYSGVEIREDGNPTLRHNRINNNASYAVYVHHGGGGTIEDNDLRNNAKGAWLVTIDSVPKVKRARNQE
jgi:parallel beta-helix repeat protein